MSLFKGVLITAATLLLTACGQPSETTSENKTTAETEETTAILKKVSASLPIWTENDDPLADFEALLEELNAQE